MTTSDRRLALIARFAQRNATIDIVGMAYVGLPLAFAYVDADEMKAPAQLIIARGGRYRGPSEKVIKA